MDLGLMSSTLIFCLTVVYIVERVITLWLAEQRRKQAQVKAKPSEPVPMDLMVWASRWSDQWAREQAMSALEDAYAKSGDWNRVRQELMGA